MKDPVAAVIDHGKSGVGPVSGLGNTKAGDINMDAEAALDGGGPGWYKKSICGTCGRSIEIAECRRVIAE